MTAVPSRYCCRGRQTRLRFGSMSALGAAPSNKTSSSSSDPQQAQKAAGKPQLAGRAGARLRKGIQLWDSPFPACTGHSALPHVLPPPCRAQPELIPCLSHPFPIVTTKNQTRFKHTSDRLGRKTRPGCQEGRKVAIFRGSHPTQQISRKGAGMGLCKPCTPLQQHPDDGWSYSFCVFQLPC